MSDLPLGIITEEMVIQAARSAGVKLEHIVELEIGSGSYQGWENSPAYFLASCMVAQLRERFVSMFELAGALASTNGIEPEVKS